MISTETSRLSALSIILQHDVQSEYQMKSNNSVNAIVSGGIAGLAGSLAMNAVSWIWAKANTGAVSDVVQHGTRPDVAAAQEAGAPHPPIATAKLADRLAAPVLDRPLSPRERDTGGKLVHYAFGTGMGVMYGIGMKELNLQRAFPGIPFGLAIWAGAVLGALPALRLSAPPRHYGLRHHSLGLVGHLAYGGVLGAVYQCLHGKEPWND